jgi:hypothetical protein
MGSVTVVEFLIRFFFWSTCPARVNRDCVSKVSYGSRRCTTLLPLSVLRKAGWTIGEGFWRIGVLVMEEMFGY